MLRATTTCTFSTSQLPKVVREWCVLHILTSKRASRHNGVHFFDISTAKSGPHLVCLPPLSPPHFDFEMCFAPQRRALLRHLNYQKWSAPGVFCNILTWKCASRHNGVHFFDISTSKNGPNLVCFVHFDFEMCFAPQRRSIFSSLSSGQLAPHPPLAYFSTLLSHKSLEKHGVSRLSYLFARLHLLSSDSFSSSLLSSDLSLLSASSLLCFSS